MNKRDFQSGVKAHRFQVRVTLREQGKVGHVAIWDLATAAKVGEVETPIMYTWDPRQRRHSIGGIRSLAFSPDSKQLAIGGIGKIGNIDHLGVYRLVRVDPQTLERVDSPAQIDSWNRVWTFFSEHLRPYQGS